jgi:N-acetylmuramoyl-L-alanine amidase
MPIVVIDVGHGWVPRGKGQPVYDPGAVGRFTLFNQQTVAYEEHEIAKAYAWSLQRALQELGCGIEPVVLLARPDAPLSLAARRQFKPNADAFISLHLNASQGVASGTETYYHNKNSKRLAELVQQSAVRSLNLPDRGVKQADFAVLKREKPAVLHELGFITNLGDVRHLLLNTTRTAWAQAVAYAFKRFFEEGK